MSDASSRSGTAVSLGFVALVVAVLAVLLLVSPRLNADIERRFGGAPPDRSVITNGELAGHEWVAATEVAGGRGCVVVEIDGDQASEVCAGGDDVIGGLAVAPVPDDGRWFASGVVDAEVPLVRVALSDGQERILVPRGGRTGFLAGFWVTLVDPDVVVDAVQAMDRADEVLATLSCDGPVATRDGVTAADLCQVHSGGQG